MNNFGGLVMISEYDSWNQGPIYAENILILRKSLYKHNIEILLHEIFLVFVKQKDKTADLDAKWKHCAITQEPLREPIMACELGR